MLSPRSVASAQAGDYSQVRTTLHLHTGRAGMQAGRRGEGLSW